jgi:hypothetical protein
MGFTKCTSSYAPTPASTHVWFCMLNHIIKHYTNTSVCCAHRIGRTGRSGKTGVATTFINTRQCEESILLDLKHLLKEARQRVPHFLQVGGGVCAGEGVVMWVWVRRGKRRGG